MERLFVLKGQITGLARYRDGELSLPAQARGLSVYLTERGGKTLPAEEAAAAFWEEAEGILLLCGEKILARGGFLGKRALLEKAEGQARLHAQRKNVQRESFLGEKRETAAESAPRPEATLPPQETASLPKAGNSEALEEILLRARELFGPLYKGTEGEEEDRDRALAAAQSLLDPFPGVFPGACWQRVPYPGTERHYLEGRYSRKGQSYRIRAIPGSYAPVPPLKGYGRFLRARDGSGYWIRVFPIR